MKKSNLKRVIIEIFGWYGAVAIVFAYVLVSFSVLEPTSITFQLLNVSGSLGIIIVSLSKKVFQSVTLNTIWLVVGIVAIIKILF